MKTLLEIINKVKNNENLIFEEEETLDNYTLLVKNFILSKEDLKNIEQEFKRYIFLSIETSNLYNFINEPNNVLELLDHPDNFELKLNFKKNDYLNNKFNNKNIKLILSQKLYIDKFESLSCNEKNLDAIIVAKDEYYYNDTYIVTNLYRDYNSDVNTFNSLKFENQLAKIKKNCNWSNIKVDVVPENIYIDFENNNFIINKNIEEIIIKNTVKAIVKSIFNFTEIDHGVIKSTLFGNKTILVDFIAKDQSYTKESYKNLYELYEWIYFNKNNATDKLSVTRSVISALISAKWHQGCPNSELDVILENVSWVKKSSDDNFQKITDGNVNDYFKEKNNILELLKKDIGSVNDSILEITKNINTNLTVGIGAIIAGSLGYVAKQDFAMIKIICLIYAIYISINTALNLYLIYKKKKRVIVSFELKFNKYKEEYLEDDYLLNVKTEKDSNENIFNFYFTCSIIFVVIIDILAGWTIYSKDFLPWIFNIFK